MTSITSQTYRVRLRTTEMSGNGGDDGDKGTREEAIENTEDSHHDDGGACKHPYDQDTQRSAKGRDKKRVDIADVVACQTHRHSSQRT